VTNRQRMISGRVFIVLSWVVVTTLQSVGYGLAQGSLPTSNRLLPKDVTWRNVDDFESQVRRDLPIGTSASDVEEYLRRWTIGYEFHNPDSSAKTNTIVGALDNLGYRAPFFPRLLFYFSLDADKVTSIRFHVEYF
jgi:hypothetical protein